MALLNALKSITGMMENQIDSDPDAAQYIEPYIQLIRVAMEAADSPSQQQMQPRSVVNPAMENFPVDRVLRGDTDIQVARSPNSSYHSLDSVEYGPNVRQIAEKGKKIEPLPTQRELDSEVPVVIQDGPLADEQMSNMTTISNQMPVGARTLLGDLVYERRKDGLYFDSKQTLNRLRELNDTEKVEYLENWLSENLNEEDENESGIITTR